MKTSASSPKKPVKKALSEQALQMLCWQWVQKTHPGLLIFHVANERKGSIGAAMHFKRMGVLPGVADFLAFPSGRAVAIELKDDVGKQRAGQAVFQSRWEAAGNAYFVARTLEEFQGVVAALTVFA